MSVSSPKSGWVDLFELWAKDVDESELMMVTNNARSGSFM
jgi:hypothetical protein